MKVNMTPLTTITCAARASGRPPVVAGPGPEVAIVRPLAESVRSTPAAEKANAVPINGLQANGMHSMPYTSALCRRACCAGR
jgi:hypothetical protein